MDPVHTSLLDSVSAFFLTETRRIAGQCQRQFFFRNNLVDKLSDHRMLAGSDQIQILALDLIHHGFHLRKAHNAVHDISVDHKRRHTVGKSAVDHKVTGIRQNSGMQSRNVSHQVVKTVSGNFSCAVQINTIERFHNVCVIWNLKIRNDRIAKTL